MVSKSANPPRPTGPKGLHRTPGVVADPDHDKPQATPVPRKRVKTPKPEGPLSASKQRRAAHKEQLEQRFLEAARALIAKRGVAALTLREVAAAVGYSHAMIYSFFDDKQALLARLGQHGEQSFVETLERVRASADAPPPGRPKEGRAPAGGSERSERGGQAALAAFARTYVDWALAHPHEYRQLFAGAQTGAVYALLRAAIADGTKRDELRAQTLWAGLHGLVMLELGAGQAVAWRPLEERISALLSL